MELKWIEDLLAFSHYGSFSLAAASRHVTQSAFSRRIQALEEWLGGEVIDRSRQPAALTDIGRLVLAEASPSVTTAYELRDQVREGLGSACHTLKISSGFALCESVLATWMTETCGLLDKRVRIKVLASGIDDAVQTFLSGRSDFLLCYHHPALPLPSDLTRYPWTYVGTDRLVPVCAPLHAGVPIFASGDNQTLAAPVLTYAERTYLGRAQAYLLNAHPAGRLDGLRRSHESHMAMVLRAAAIAGHGVAWLPQSMVLQHLAQGTLVRTCDETLTLPLDVRIYKNSALPL
ncbi:LysR family transcriptional regulator [Pandoraea anhela]|uniref:LysR family transcriptional regulator n=1 Tax=Pandoraea anhela TaxID=2508295 RepID=A0A5E4WF46_9BURK|nr:LysR family transcriptional regulator [Pandoraea anhela]VVE21936.1 LysR family transcriptional regulator [Pandoraea anhela]